MSANFTPEKEDLKILTPFKMQVLTNFPYIEADFDALTNYQLLCKIVEYLNNTISEMNEVTTQTEGLYNAYVSLENYVNDYFDNLDLQEEINKKLDEMAEDGSLAQIISQYVDPYFNAFTEQIETDLADYKVSINNQVTTMENKIDSLSNGSPLVASSTSEMTDTTKVYVNTTDGKWYYYNGSVWTPGGDYQSSGIGTNSVEPDMLKYVNLYNLYNVPEIEYNKFGGNYQRLIIPAKAGEVYGAFYRKADGTFVRSYSGNGTSDYTATLIYFFNNTMTDPDNSVGRIGVNVNPETNITAPANTAWLVLYLANATTNPYKPNDFMLCEMTDKDADNLTYYPYGYFFTKPYIIDDSYKLKDRLENIEETLAGVSNPYPHQNKKILGLGDSYTFLNYYGPYLEDETKAEFTPRGSNGASIRYIVSDYYTPTGGDGSTSYQPITAELLAQYDAVTCMAGTNNYGQSMNPLGTINDEIGAYTTHGDIKLVINKILSLKPDMPIIWCTEPFRLSYGEQPAPGGYEPNSQGYTMQDVAHAIMEECEHFGIPCYNFYAVSGWNSYSVRREGGDLVSNKFTYDGLHPKNGDGNGADLLGRSFGAFINTLRF